MLYSPTHQGKGNGREHLTVEKKRSELNESEARAVRGETSEHANVRESESGLFANDSSSRSAKETPCGEPARTTNGAKTEIGRIRNTSNRLYISHTRSPIGRPSECVKWDGDSYFALLQERIERLIYSTTKWTSEREKR